ncbi:unnamed protein product [Cunninghamella blakesleeana]
MATAQSNCVLLKDVRPMMRNIECEVIVLQPESEPIVTRDGDVIYRFIIADKTGAIIINVWGETGELLKSGDILRLSGVDSKLRQGQLLLVLFKRGKVKRLGQDTFIFAEGPNYSEIDTNKLNTNQQRLQQSSSSSSQNRSLAITATINNIEQQHHQQQQQQHGYNKGSKKFNDFGRGNFNNRNTENSNIDDNNNNSNDNNNNNNSSSSNSSNSNNNAREIRRKRPYDYQQQQSTPSDNNEMKSRRKVEYNELS